MQKSFWIIAVALAASLSACMPAAVPPPPPVVDVMGAEVVPEPEPVPLVCTNGNCVPVN